ncbi:MAG: ComEA family DNA-binding protein [Oscillospiraceae bacterium]|nr:ComEA family DNA-binding protein [Oscillospiraceae bacterium]MBQ2157095.1 ComEA family DNA-binding protein [Oscillospiraceae bacterium]
MKDKASVKWILAITFLVVCFAVGFFFGHSGKWHSVTISPKVQTEYEPAYESGEVESNIKLTEASNDTAGIVNINTAGVEQLQTLPGIGEALAKRIIEYREEFGPFQSVDELQSVSGIGKAKLDSIRDKITV